MDLKPARVTLDQVRIATRGFESRPCHEQASVELVVASNFAGILQLLL